MSIFEAVVIASIGDGKVIAQIPFLNQLSLVVNSDCRVGEKISVLLSTLTLSNDLSEMALGLPEDVRNSPHLASVLARKSGVVVDSFGRLASTVIEECRILNHKGKSQ